MTTTYLETRHCAAGDLLSYPGNARRGDVNKILESLRSNGQYRSLIVRCTDAGLTVLAGNHTLAAHIAHAQPGADCDTWGRENGRRCALCAGDGTVRCELVRCDEATARRINLVDNRSAELGDYDSAALAEVLRAASEEGSLTGTGWGDEDLEGLLTGLETEEAGAVAEEAPYTPGEVSYNDSEEDRAARIASHGGEGSVSRASRGVRDILMALPTAQADELGRLVMRLRETLGALSQGEIILAAARMAVDAPDADLIRLRVEQVVQRVTQLPRAKSDQALGALLRSLQDEVAPAYQEGSASLSDDQGGAETDGAEGGQ